LLLAASKPQGGRMLTNHVALVSEIKGHDPSDVARVTAALQRQAIRDFRPIWDVEATVDSFPVLEDVPLGYWLMNVREDIGFPGAAGIHLDDQGQPFALISMSDSWSLTASHELLEMLADPFGNRLVPGESPHPDQGRVEFLVEVCDPSEAAEFGYTVNDILMSDFYTPQFFDPVAAEGVRYSFTSAVTEPRTILEGGYVSWHEPVSDHWWQQIWFGAEAEFRDLGVFEADAARSLRSWIDAQTEHPGIDGGLEKSDATLMRAVAAGAGTARSASAKATGWREQIAALLNGTGS
jgi:hypothetical protein